MSNITITATGIAEAIRALELAQSPDLASAIADAVADDAVLPRIREYPSPSGRPQPFRSAASRRFFFAALRSGQISVPYRRTGQLKAKWTKARSGSGAIVSNSQSYAALVQGEPGEQGDYFRGVWPSVTEVASAVQAQEAQSIAERTAEDFFRRAGL